MSSPAKKFPSFDWMRGVADCLVMTLAMVPAMSVPAELAKAADALAARVSREVARGRAAGVADILGANGAEGHA